MIQLFYVGIYGYLPLLYWVEICNVSLKNINLNLCRLDVRSLARSRLLETERKVADYSQIGAYRTCTSGKYNDYPSVNTQVALTSSVRKSKRTRIKSMFFTESY